MEYKTLLMDFYDFIKERQLNVPFNFNLLDEQVGHIAENSHTNILIKLLGYKNQHGYEFLSKLFKYIGWNIEIDENKELKFDTEKFIKSEGRIDGYISQEGNFTIIIENKVNDAGNQPNQLKRYIEDIERKETPENIWVIYLTKNGQKSPDEQSIKYMIEKGILAPNDNKNELLENEGSQIEGSRYAALNYNDDILPWLKDIIQPCVMQKEVVLNTGLIQYIDYLEGMLGIRKSDSEAMEIYKKKIKELLGLDITEKESKFEEYYKILNSIKDEKKNKDFIRGDIKKLINDDKERNKIFNIIDNTIRELYDEPLKLFYDITKEYFTEKLGIKDCIIRHPDKNLSYIQIRDASWPIYVHFEWLPLYIDKEGESKLFFHAESKYADIFTFIDKGNKRRSKLLYDEKNCRPILNMNPEELRNFLNRAYSTISPEFVRKIYDTLAQNGI